MSEEQAKTTNKVGEDDSTVEKEEQNKLEDPAVKDREKKKHYYGSFLIDGSVAVVLFVLAFLDKFRFSKTVPNYSGLPENPYSCIIVLLPAVVAILAVSLSLSKEKIYGVTLRDIKTLRGPFYFDFLHVVIVMAAVILLGFIFYALDLKITLYSLEIVAFLYALYFAVQDIPVMACQNWLLRIILQRNYQVIHSDNLLQEDRARETFDTMMTNIVLEEGMDTAYKALTKCNRREINPSQILEDLIDYEFRFFQDYQKDFSEKHSVLNPECSSESITKKIDHGYKNILHLLSYDSDGILYGVLSPDKFCSITKCIYALHELCSVLGLEAKEGEQIIGLFEDEMPSYLSKPKKSLATSAVVCMLSSTLYKGETWFVRYLRDCEDSLRYLISFGNNPLGIFTSMLIYHAKFPLNDAQKKEIEVFLKEPEEGINSHGDTWQSAMQFSLEFARPTDVIKSIGGLLLFYNSISSIYFTHIGNGGYSRGDSKDEFTKFDLFHDWLLLVFASVSCGDFSPDVFDEAMEELDKEDKDVLVEELSQNWLLNDKLRDDVDCSFLKFYDGDDVDETSAVWAEESFVDKLVELRSDHIGKRHGTSSAATVDNSIEDAKKVIIDSFNDATKKYKYYDPSLKVNEGDEKPLVTIWVKGTNWGELLINYSKYLSTDIALLVESEIKKNAVRFENSDSDSREKIIKRIKEFNPDFTSSRDWQIITKETENPRLAFVPKISSSQLFWKENAIHFNAKINETDLVIRSLTSTEIEELIQREYTEFENGLYRYRNVANDKKHSYYVTRKELVQLLGETNRIITINCRYAVSIEPERVLFIDQKVDW